MPAGSFNLYDQGDSQVYGSTPRNYEKVTKQSINHCSKKRSSKFNSLWDTTIGVAPWRQGTTDSHRLGSVGQKGSYPDMQSLINIQETQLLLKENFVIDYTLLRSRQKMCEQSSFLFQLSRVSHGVNKSVFVQLSDLPEHIIKG